MQPARVKHPKVHKGNLKAKATRGTYLSFGSFGLKAEESSWIKANQLEACYDEVCFQGRKDLDACISG